MNSEVNKASLDEQRLELDCRIQQSRLDLDERRLNLDKEGQDKRVEIDLTRLKREGRFFRANAAAIITSIVTIFAAGITGYQFHLSQKEQAARAARDLQSKNDELQLRRNETNLKVMDYITAHSAGIFSKEPDTVLRYRTIFLATLPTDVRAQVFEQLRQSESPTAKLWVIGTITYRWTRVGTGDCGGRDVARSTGPTPDKAICGPSTEGQVSVCWKDWCTYKLATPQSCIGGGSPGEMYQCIFDAQDK